MQEGIKLKLPILTSADRPDMIDYYNTMMINDPQTALRDIMENLIFENFIRDGISYNIEIPSLHPILKLSPITHTIARTSEFLVDCWIIIGLENYDEFLKNSQWFNGGIIIVVTLSKKKLCCRSEGHVIFMLDIPIGLLI